MSDGYSPLFIGFPGDEPDWDWLAQVRPIGVILFTRNVRSPQQVQDLCFRLRGLAYPPMIAIDMEGGRINRLHEVLGPFPGLNQIDGVEVARDTGFVMGQLLFSLGIDINFAPVVDLDYGQPANALQQRTVGSDPVHTARIAASYLLGMRQAGVEGCFKHFPGLGTTIPDSHESLPEYQGDQSRWKRDEYRVYRLLAENGFGATPVMFAHCRYPFWPGEIASVGPSAVAALRQLGWSGMLLTDDFEMKALPQDQLPQLANQALRNGMDAVMICHDAKRIDRVRASLAPELISPSAEAMACRQWTLSKRDEVHALALADAITRWQSCGDGVC